MKILFIHRNLPPDSYTGVALQVHRLANELTQKGHQLHILTLSQKPFDALYNVITISSAFLEFKIASIFKRILVPFLFSKVKLKDYDIIHVHGDGGFLPYGKNVLRTFYGTAQSEMKRSKTLKGKLAQLFSSIMEKKEDKKCLAHSFSVGISPSVKQHLKSVQKIIPCMLSPSFLSLSPSSPKSSSPSILFMGSTNSRKRGEWAMELYLNLKESIPDLVMHYVGNQIAQDKAYFSKLNRHHCDSILFYEKISQEKLTSLYRTSWVYLSLSSYEGFGVSLIEAMYSQCLVVTTETEGSRFIFNDLECYFSINKNTALSNLKKSLINLSLNKKMTQLALIASQNYLPSVIGEKYENTYKELLSRVK